MRISVRIGRLAVLGATAWLAATAQAAVGGAGLGDDVTNVDQRRPAQGRGAHVVDASFAEATAQGLPELIGRHGRSNLIDAALATPRELRASTSLRAGSPSGPLAHQDAPVLDTEPDAGRSPAAGARASAAPEPSVIALVVASLLFVGSISRRIRHD